MKTFILPEKLVELATRRDATLANEANFDESKHPRASDGKFSSTGGGGATVTKVDKTTTPAYKSEQRHNAELDKQVAGNRQKTSDFFRKRAAHEVTMQKMLRNAPTRLDKANYINNVLQHERGNDAAISAAHRSSIFAGLTYNHSLHRYE